MSKGMSFEKFAAIINIICGVLLFTIGGFIAAFGILLVSDSSQLILDILKPQLTTAQYDVIREALDKLMDGASKDVLKTVFEGKDVPSWLRDFIVDLDLETLLMGVGFGVVGYAIIVNFVFTGLVLRSIKRARQRRGNVSRLFILFTGFLSLIPFVIPGILIILGAFGHKPQGRRQLARSRRAPAPRGRGPRRVSPYGPRRAVLR